MKYIAPLIALCIASTCYAGDTGTIKVCRTKEPGGMSTKALDLAVGMKFAGSSNLSITLTTTAAARIAENEQCAEVAAKVSDNPLKQELNVSEPKPLHYAGMSTAAQDAVAPDEYTSLHAMIASGFAE